MANTDITPKEESQLPAGLLGELETEAGVGFEGTSSDDYAIPFISILQKGSPQCDEDSDSYVEGAKPGLFWDSGASEILSDSDGNPLEQIRVTPACYQRLFVQWRDRDEGGGFVATHTPDSELVRQGVRDDRGRLVLQDNTYLVDTRQFYCFLYGNDGTARPVVLSMSSTQLKKARQWMTRMADFKVQGSKGPFTPPMYGQVWPLSTVGESNSKGSWRGWKLGAPQIVEDGLIISRAKELREGIEGGKVKSAEPGTENGGGKATPSSVDAESDEPPF